MRTPFDLIQALRSWFHAKDGAIFTGGHDVDTGGGDVIVGAGSVDGVDLTAHVADGDAHHNESHTVVSHSDTTATGSELDTLTDGSDASVLHAHDGRYFQESEFSSDPGSNSKPLESDSSGFLVVERLHATNNIRTDGGIVLGSLTHSVGAGILVLKEIGAPSTPTSGFGVLWVSTSGDLWFKNDAGTATNLTP